MIDIHDLCDKPDANNDDIHDLLDTDPAEPPKIQEANKDSGFIRNRSSTNPDEIYNFSRPPALLTDQWIEEESKGSASPQHGIKMIQIE
jgi:hypothetical protein